MKRIILRSRLLWLPYVSCCTGQGGNATVHRSVAKEKKKKWPFRILLPSIQKLMLPPSGKYHRNIIRMKLSIPFFFFFLYRRSFLLCL